MHLIIVLTVLSLSVCRPASAKLIDLKCVGEQIKEYNSYIRLIKDTDEFYDEDFTASCTLKNVNIDWKKPVIIDMGIRMTDTVKHDDVDNDYLLVNLGGSTVQTNTDNLFIKSGNDEKQCKVKVFEKEQTDAFSHTNVFYIRYTIRNNILTVMYSLPNSNRWTQCSSISINPQDKDFSLSSYSEFGINIDIVSFEINSKSVPWRNGDTMENLESPMHIIEHGDGMKELEKNITKKEINKIKSSVSYLWYYDVFLTFTISFLVYKYRREQKKLHLF